MLIVAGISVCLAFAVPGCSPATPGIARDLSDLLRKELSVNIPVPDGVAGSRNISDTMIYVLGGTQSLLKYHFQIAADIFSKGIARKVYILSRPGITEYNKELMRNMTNDEWSVRKLGEMGVPPKDVEAIPVPSSIFGTLSEGRRISRFAKEKGYKRIILISSSHHTRRVLITFSCFMNKSIEIYIYGSRDYADMGTIIVEYAKYILYRSILIPALNLMET